MRCTCDHHRDSRLLAEQAVAAARLAYREREAADNPSLPESLRQMARRRQRHYERGVQHLSALLEN